LDYYNFHRKETNWDNIQTYFEQIDWENTLKDKSTSKILKIIYERTTETTKFNVPLKKDPNNKQISKQERIHMNLARKRRKINKQYQRATSQTKKQRLYEELIQIEVKLQKLQRNSQEYQEKKACAKQSKSTLNTSSAKGKYSSRKSPLGGGGLLVRVPIKQGAN